MAKTISREPIIKVGSFLEQIPFVYDLYIAEKNLTEEVTISPIIAGGAPEDAAPVVGAKVMYRLVGTTGGFGANFDSIFKIDSASTVIDTTPGAINIVTMWYDGTDFWLNIANTTPIPPAPTGGVDKIGDFGLGAGVIVPRLNTAATMIYTAADGGHSQITAFDLITSIHYVDGGTLTYGLRKFTDPTPFAYVADPKDAVIDLGCIDLGQQEIEVSITDGITTSPVLTVYVTIYDATYCI